MAKRIYRSKKDRKIAGVCGGLAQYFDIDPAFVRIVFLIAFVCLGFGLIAYLIFWLCIPSEP